MTDLNIKAGDEDFQCLLSSPVSNNAVKWSEDNLLAVSTERGLCILSPCKLPGARQYAVADEEAEGQQIGGCGPAENIHARLLELKGPRNRGQSFGQSSWMRCIDWSPQGCSLQNTCLLAAIHEGLATKVCIYAPPKASTSKWVLSVDLMASLLEYCEASGWRDAVPCKPEAGAPESPHISRLRGGGPKRHRHDSNTSCPEAEADGEADNAEMDAPDDEADKEREQERGAKRPAKMKPSKPTRALEQGPPEASMQYKVPQDFGASCLGPVITTNARAVETCIFKNAPNRFLQLRHEIPEGERQTYSRPREHLKGSDLALLERVAAEYQAAHGVALTALGITNDQVSTFIRRGLRKRWNPVHGVLEAEQPRPQKPPDKPAAHAAAAAPQQDASATLTPVEAEDTTPAYELPQEFDPAVMLPGADASSKASIIDTFPLVFCLRWLTLRNELPEDEWEVYEKGQHLRGADAAYADQALDELYGSFAEQVAAAGITKKLLLKEGKRMIRLLAIQTGAPMRVPPSIIHQYNLHRMHARMLELLARQFPNSYAIAPVNERGTWSGTESARRRRKPVADEDYQANISADAFEQRLFSTSALQVAWSPAWGEAGCRHAMIAVSTKSGRVWLWRYHLPSEYDTAAESKSLSERFALVGSVAAHASWVTALSWASCKGHVLLATGCAEGAVRIYAASAAGLSALPDAMANPSTEAAARVMRLLAVVAEPDFRQVSCLDLRTQPSGNSGECSLQLAVGKSAGLVGAWDSPSLSSIPEGKRLLGSLCCARRGSASVAGLAWAAPPTLGLSRAPVLTAAALDGSLMSWRWDGQELRPCGAPQAPPGSQASMHTTAKGKPCRAFGLASSGNGLLVAVARETPYAKQLDYAGGHMFKKVWQGSVQLLQLVGSDAPLGAEVLPRLDLQQLLTRGLPFPAHTLWDVAAAVAAEEQGELEEGGSSDLALMQEKLDGLDCLPASRGATISRCSAAARAKQALQLSNAQQRLLVKRLQGSPEELVLQMQQRIARNEFAVLEEHVSRCLQHSAQPQSLASMQSWADVHSQAHPWPPAGAADDAWERMAEAVAEAACIVQECGGVLLQVPRCPVTFERCIGLPRWRCVLCERSFKQIPEMGLPPSCLYCGVALSQPQPPAPLQMPALC